MVKLRDNYGKYHEYNFLTIFRDSQIPLHHFGIILVDYMTKPLIEFPPSDLVFSNLIFHPLIKTDIELITFPIQLGNLSVHLRAKLYPEINYEAMGLNRFRLGS